MPIAGTIVFWMLLTAGAIALGSLGAKAHHRRMEALAQRLGLTYHRPGFGATSRIDGVFHGHPVVAIFHAGRNPYTEYELAEVKQGVSFGKESWLFRGNDDVQTGDAAFDRKVRIEGGEAELLALLDGETRAAVQELVHLGGTVADGRIRLRRPGARESDVQDILEKMWRVASRLPTGRPHVARHLAQRARGGDLPPVRRRALQVLLARFRDRDETREACEALLRDADPSLRLMAAQSLGHAGLAALRAILADASIAPDVRAEALDHLTRRGDPEVARPLARGHLKDREPAVRKTAIEAAGRLKDHDALALLMSITGRVEDDQKAAIAAALGRIGDPAAEETLIGLLGGSPGVRLEAATALGALGTVRAVEPLRSVAGSGLLASEAARAATDAIRAIQSRIEGADHGQLTIAESGEAGALSLGDTGANARRGAAAAAKKV